MRSVVWLDNTLAELCDECNGHKAPDVGAILVRVVRRPAFGHSVDFFMPQTGLGVALKTLRERRTLSLREVGQLASVDHAYVHRLESGDKTSPSQDLLGKLVKVLKPSARDAEIVNWLAMHEDADPLLVEFVLKDDSVELEVFTAAAGVRHRGATRPDPAVLIARTRRIFEEDDEEG